MKQSIVALLALGFLVFEAVLIAFVDRPLSEYLRSVDAQYPAYIDFFRAYTDIGKSKWYLITSGVGVVLCAVTVRLPSLEPQLRQNTAKLGTALLFCFVCIALSGIATDILKPLIGRARPVMLDREGIYGFHPLTFQAAWNSMPSGHATTAFTLACLGIFFIPRAWLLWIFIAAMMTISRPMVNAHYLSDILAGAAVGCLTFFLLYRLVNHNVINLIRCSIFPIDRKKRSS